MFNRTSTQLRPLLHLTSARKHKGKEMHLYKKATLPSHAVSSYRVWGSGGEPVHASEILISEAGFAQYFWSRNRFTHRSLLLEAINPKWEARNQVQPRPDTYREVCSRYDLNPAKSGTQGFGVAGLLYWLLKLKAWEWVISRVSREKISAVYWVVQLRNPIVHDGST